MGTPTAPTLMADKCCLTSLPAAISTTRAPHHHPFLHLPSRPIRHIHLAFSTHPLLSLRKISPLVPFTARTSEAEQEEQSGPEGSGWENGQEEYEEWQKGPDAAVEGEGEEEEEVSGVVEEEAEEGNVEESYPEPPEEAKLFVGNLPYDLDSEGLAKLFDQAGIVEIAEVIYNRETDQSRGFGFITMSTVEEAEKAVEMFNRYDINGRLLTVNKAAPRGSRPERPPRDFGPSFRIYVGNLPWQVDDSRLEQVFSEHGKVVDARVVYDRETGRSRGFGFVTMSTQVEVDDAIAALDGQSLDGRALRVNVAEERPRRTF